MSKRKAKGKRSPKPKRPKHLGVGGYLALALLGVAALLGATFSLWYPRGYTYEAWLLAWSLVTFVMYALDKRAAARGSDARGKSQAPRINELALHLCALFGGFIGGFIGRHGLRHKTRKPVFAVVLALASLAHTAALLQLRFALLW